MCAVRPYFSACSADIAFIMDASGSMTRDFPAEKQVVKAIVKSTDIAPDMTRAALIYFSEETKVAVPFGKYATTAKILAAVDAVPFIGRRTRIDKALKKANDEVFKYALPGRPKIAVVLTDGKQTPPALGLRFASRGLRNAGVRVIAMAVSRNAEPERLRLMTERDEDVMIANDIQKMKALMRNACRKYLLECRFMAFGKNIYIFFSSMIVIKCLSFKKLNTLTILMFYIYPLPN